MTPARPLGAFGAVWFTYFAAIGLFNTYAPLWFKSLGLSLLVIGGIASLQSWTRVLAPYGWSWLADRNGQRIRTLRWASALALVAALALALAGPLGTALIVACVVLLFVANGAVVPLSEASLAHHLHTERGLDTARYGRVRVWGSLGFIVAVAAGGFVLQGTGVAAFPWFVVATFAALLWMALRLPASHDTVRPHARSEVGALQVLRRPAVAWFFASVFFTVLAHTSLYAFFSLYLDVLGQAKSAIGLMWGVAVGVEIVFFWFQGRWFERLTLHGWLVAAAGVAMLRFAGVALFGNSLGLLALTQLTHAVTFAAHHAACIALIHRHFPGALRARGQALYSTLGYGLSGVVGGLAGGVLSEHLGFAAVFWAGSAMAAVGAMCALRAAHHERAAAPAP